VASDDAGSDYYEQFRELYEEVGKKSIELSLVEVDFIRFAIGLQEQEALDTDEPSVAGMISDLSDRLLDLFSPVAWAQYHTAVEGDTEDD
jgi:hypothetical protein